VAHNLVVVKLHKAAPIFQLCAIPFQNDKLPCRHSIMNLSLPALQKFPAS
jgi:hypothetical protein